MRNKQGDSDKRIRIKAIKDEDRNGTIINNDKQTNKR